MEIVKKDVEIWWRGSYQQNLAWIYAAVSEKLEFTNGRTTNACAMTVALLTKSGRAKKTMSMVLTCQALPSIKRHSRATEFQW